MISIPKISIIVPVFNTCRLLSRCLDSLINQTFKEIEIIIINDGSTDSSIDICNNYSKRDSRIIVFNQENSGLSIARNNGILYSKSPYLMFVDSDDYIDLKSCEVLYDYIEKSNCEIVTAGYIIEKNDSRKYFKNGLTCTKKLSGEEFLVKSIKENKLSMCAPYSIYKKNIILNNKLFFKEKLLHEDELWTPQVFLAAESVLSIDFYFYYHCIREGSITQSVNKTKNAMDLISICFDLFIIYKNLQKKYRKYLNDYICTLYLSSVYIGKLTKVNRYFPLRTASSLKNKLKSLLYLFSPSLYMFVRSKRRIQDN